MITQLISTVLNLVNRLTDSPMEVLKTFFGSWRGRRGAARTTQQEVDKLITNLPSLISRTIYQESKSSPPDPTFRSGPLTLRAPSTQTSLANEVRSKTGLANNVRQARNKGSSFGNWISAFVCVIEVYAVHFHHCLCGTSGSSVLLQLQSSVPSFS